MLAAHASVNGIVKMSRKVKRTQSLHHTIVTLQVVMMPIQLLIASLAGMD